MTNLTVIGIGGSAAVYGIDEATVLKEYYDETDEGLQHIHNNGIIHADFGCSNMILVEDRVKIVDFGGCSIDDSEALTCYNWYNCRDSRRPSVETDMFAFGCAVFEILTGKPPYHEHKGRPEQVRLLYAQNQFPAVEHLPLHEVMLGCWHGTFSSMDEGTRILKTACIVDEKSVTTASTIKTRGCFQSFVFSVLQRFDKKTSSANG